jgi:transcription-repair coupling factor (superfamily II helicase)
MYMQLLEQTIRELKGEEIEDDRRASVNLRIDLRIADEYVPDMNQRLTIYRRLASVGTLEAVDGLLEELRDRYGPPPVSVQNLAQYARIRLMADRVGLESLDREGAIVVLKFRMDAPLDPVRILKMVQARGDLQLLPPAVLKLDLYRRTLESGRRETAGRSRPRKRRPGGRRAPRPRSRLGSHARPSSPKFRPIRPRPAGCSKGSARSCPNWHRP